MREKKSYPSFLADQFNIRFPDGMRDRIAAIAKENGRSMNSEIIARLEHSFSEEMPLRSGAVDLNGLLSAGMILATGKRIDDPAVQFLIAKANEAAERLANIAYQTDKAIATGDAKK